MILINVEFGDCFNNDWIWTPDNNFHKQHMCFESNIYFHSRFQQGNHYVDGVANFVKVLKGSVMEL